MSPAMAPAAFESQDFVTRYVERNRGAGCSGIANLLREQEALDARLAVQSMQTGHDATWYLEQAARARATRYEFAATGADLEQLYAERLAELRRRTGAAA